MTDLAISYSTSLPVTPSVPTGQLLAVEFRSTDGRSWHAIGGGPTITKAIRCAHESCPDDVTWVAVRWNGLYGD
jgi:hypothetical protein